MTLSRSLFRRTRPVLLVGSLIVVGACSDELPTHGTPSVRGPSASLAAVSQSEVPDQMAVAQAVPGFGGYFIDAEGRPTVYLTDVSQRPAAEQALAGFLDSFGWTAADLVVRQGQYDFAQLQAWHDASWKDALTIEGAVFSDVDESSNRIRFGGVDQATLASIVSTVTDLGVPSEAVTVELSSPAVQTASLRDRHRPTRGGIQINFFSADASPLSYVCTLGFNALFGSDSSLITNSHCSNNQGGSETATDYYQALRRTGSVTGGYDYYPDTDTTALVAKEVHDPHYWVSLDCPPGRTCRYSDASRAKYHPGKAGPVGYVARAEITNTTLHGNDAPQVLVIDSINPTWRLTAEQPYPVMGQTLNKTGRTTGWTQGPVTGTCANVNVSGSLITQLCQSYVSAFVAGGDSGSPTFGQHTDGTAFLAGILWGSSTNLVTGVVRFIFSPLGGVERELGDLNTTHPLPIIVDPEPGTDKKQKKQK